jgi:hypothetical protein
MRRWSVILLLSLLSTSAPALPGDGTVRITERTPSGAARPAMRGGAGERSTRRPRRPRRRRASPRRRPAAQPVDARAVVRDARQGWQLLGAITDRLREISEAWFKAQEPRPRSTETAAGENQTFTVDPSPSVAPPAAAVQQEARLLARVLLFCRRQTPSRRVEQAAWRHACDELLRVAHDCAADPAGDPRLRVRPRVSSLAAATARPGVDPTAAPPGDPLERLEQMDEALARAQEIVAQYLPAD